MIAAIVLAAGLSRRMGRNKLLVELDGAAMATRAVDAVLGSAARPVIVVLGHQADRVSARLEGRAVMLIKNPDYALGLSSSLKAGLAAVPAAADGVIICLADMPGIDARLIDRLIAAFDPACGRHLVVPMRRGRRGNPILWGRRCFGDLMQLTGDVGARHLLAAYAPLRAEVEAEDDGVLIDIDTPEALAAWRGRSL